ncbi:nitrate regulatory protein [Siccibacter colletis]|uniref:nitrate regulatory protein n=1 Tax=Siccibacter colletis TaxID=1505757 RepID=UPI0004E0D05A|nr:nitrate regulatory protein [Siccibacter colletis]
MTNTAPPMTDALAWFHAARQRQRATLHQLRLVAEWSGQISHLVHMLQRERGASNVWLCSGGTLYQQERRLCAELTETRRQAFLMLLNDDTPPFSSVLCTSLACALWYLDTLPALRERILTQDIAPAAAMAGFSRVIRHLLNFIVQANDTVDNPPIARQLTALYSLMQGKELAGQERALGAIGFTRGEFDDALRQQLVDRIDGQQRCFDTFLTLTTPGQASAFQAYCTASRETERLRRLACTRLPGGNNPADLALRWFALQTERLDSLRQREEALIAGLVRETEALLRDESQEESFAHWLEQHADDEVQTPPGGDLIALVRDQARQIAALSHQLASLEATLSERKTIDKAKSLLMQHRGVSEEQAWQQLRKLAMDQNRRMVEIATAMLSVGSLLDVPRKE